MLLEVARLKGERALKERRHPFSNDGSSSDRVRRYPCLRRHKHGAIRYYAETGCDLPRVASRALGRQRQWHAGCSPSGMHVKENRIRGALTWVAQEARGLLRAGKMDDRHTARLRSAFEQLDAAYALQDPLEVLPEGRS